MNPETTSFRSRRRGSRSTAFAQGDCVEVMRHTPAASEDFILTDPPYLVHYRSRDGRAIQNGCDDRRLRPAFARACRVLRSDRFCVCFYGWSRADRFLAAWRTAGIPASRSSGVPQVLCLDDAIPPLSA
jgi:DNA modification methylase